MKHNFTITYMGSSNNVTSGNIIKEDNAYKFAGKVAASVFQGAKEIFPIDYLPTGQTING